MTLTVKIKLSPTEEQKILITHIMQECISLVNDVIDYAIAINELPSKMSSASFNAEMPSAVKNQCIMDVKSIWRKTLRAGSRFPVLKKPVATWNNQNYTILEDVVVFPVMQDGNSSRIQVKAMIPQEIFSLLKHAKLGTLRISKKNGKFIAQIAYTAAESIPDGNLAMGVDLGIKCPAVVVTDSGKKRFFGNGRQNKFVRRKHRSRRKKLGKAKKLNAIRKAQDKEQRWMKDQDHKISRAIVDFAISNNVGTIKLEALSGIRRTARTSRKNNRNLHTCSFYRLSSYIEYKAQLAGINVIYVNPAYTSQVCPQCRAFNKANGRNYRCACGFHAHRDLVSAVNILAA